MILLDTNVLSELAREAPDPAVIDWLDTIPRTELATTAITAAELHYGVTRLPEGHRKTQLAAAVRAVIDEDFRDRVEPFDTIAGSHYAAIVTERERLGRPIAMADAQIASICRKLQAMLATRNTEDFDDTGIELINPWKRSTMDEVLGRVATRTGGRVGLDQAAEDLAAERERR